MNTNDMTSSDLEASKTSDPFMYYSIPSERYSHITNVQAALNSSESSIRQVVDDSSNKIIRMSRVLCKKFTGGLLEDIFA
jgi:hypothetical protein